MTSSNPVLALFALTAVAAPAALAAPPAIAAQGLRFTGPTELYAKGRVSTEFSEIKITFNPDGTRVRWGSTNRPGGPGGWDDAPLRHRRPGRKGPPRPLRVCTREGRMAGAEAPR